MREERLGGGGACSAENESHEGKRRVESPWPIFKLHHQRSRYVYDLYHKRHAISKELYDFLLEQGYADGQLIAKWKKVGRRCRAPPCHPRTSAHTRGRGHCAPLCLPLPPPPRQQPGFENLCCLRCIQPRDTNFGAACICRVPKQKMEENKVVECILCGCRGCCG